MSLPLEGLLFLRKDMRVAQCSYMCAQPFVLLDCQPVIFFILAFDNCYYVIILYVTYIALDKLAVNPVNSKYLKCYPFPRHFARGPIEARHILVLQMP